MTTWPDPEQSHYFCKIHVVRHNTTQHYLLWAPVRHNTTKPIYLLKNVMSYDIIYEWSNSDRRRACVASWRKTLYRTSKLRLSTNNISNKFFVRRNNFAEALNRWLYLASSEHTWSKTFWLDRWSIQRVTAVRLAIVRLSLNSDH